MEKNFSSDFGKSKGNNTDRKTARKIKKQLKKEKRKYISPWKGLTIWCLIFSLGLSAISATLSSLESTLTLWAGESWEPVNKDPNAIYYPSNFNTHEELLAYGEDVCRQVEAEGAVLLKNENNALPLAKGSKVSCFSSSSVSLVYAGTGSASYSTANASTLKPALEEAGFFVNEALWNFYNRDDMAQYRRQQNDFSSTILQNPKEGMRFIMEHYFSTESILHEAPWNLYTNEVLDSVNNYNDAAIVVLSRQGGERKELEKEKFNYLALDGTEKEMLKNICELKNSGKIKKVIVLINSSNPMEMGFLDDYAIDACLQIGAVGQYGINSVAHILSGNINPSGSLVDTWCYDSFASPAMCNHTPTTFEDAKQLGVPGDADSYVVYQEGIYNGYRYYETRYEDFVMGTGNVGDYNYKSTVAFPFGYGLSYSDFKYSNMKVNYDPATDRYLIDIIVTNTGKVPGKKVVQAYFQSPYTDYDKEKEVEKSSVALCGYNKTKVLAPGESETVTVVINKRDLASYDAYGAGTYILDAGDYYLTVAENVHKAVNQILAAKGFTVESTNGRMTENADGSLAWKWTEEKFDATTYSKTLNGTPIYNKLSVADPNLYEGVNEKVTWLSRKDWTGTFPKEPAKLTLTKQLAQDLQPCQYQYQKHDTSSYKKPTMGAKNGLKLYDMFGKDYNDPAWDRLLDQLSFDDMVKLISSFHMRYAIKSVESPGARGENGTAGLNTSILKSVRKGSTATFFPSADVKASTFNNELVQQVGKVIGNDCLYTDIHEIYAPGLNLHRTPFGGRNFEYYSEDAFLTGKLSSVEIESIETKGVNTLIKHFALNESELDREGLGVWLNEQTAREIYLKAFQPSFEEKKANGAIASYIRFGAIWSGGFKNLLTGVLRDEWGCNGWLISDTIYNAAFTAPDGLLAGLTTFSSFSPAMLNFNKYKNDVLMLNLMREACHKKLYCLLNSAAMNGIGPNTTIKILEIPIIVTTRRLAIAFAIPTIFCLIKWLKSRKKWKEVLAQKQQPAKTE